MIQLKPSDIRFSQDSINNVFDKRSSHRNRRIGETLDELCEGRCTINRIPTITVVKKGEHWVTADNRRLWVFRELERLGKCDTIPVYKGFNIPVAKLTSCNGGVSVRVRGVPGGQWHSKPSVHNPADNNSFGGRSSVSANRNRTSLTNPFGSQNAFASSSQTTTSSVGQSMNFRANSSSSDARFGSARDQYAFESTRTYYANPASPANARVYDPLNATTTTSFSRQNSQNMERAQSASGNAYAIGNVPRYGLSAASMPFSSGSLYGMIRKGIDRYVSLYSYGIEILMPYLPGVDPIEKRVIRNGEEECWKRFDKHITVGQDIKPREGFGKKHYTLSGGSPRHFKEFSLSVYKSTKPNPRYVDDPGCSLFSKCNIVSWRKIDDEDYFVVEMLYDEDGQNLILEVTTDTGEPIYKKGIGQIDFMSQ